MCGGNISYTVRYFAYCFGSVKGSEKLLILKEIAQEEDSVIIVVVVFQGLGFLVCSGSEFIF
jgi:hypothetical protein